MAIYTPDVFHNTIGAVSINATSSDIPTYEQGVPIGISSTSATNTITPKNIISTQPNLLHLITFEASCLGYYLVTFNASAIGGTNRIWLLEPYKNGEALGYGKVHFVQQNISAA